MPDTPLRIVVTGARGYIGSRLVPELLSRGHEVVATATSDPTGSAFPWADQVEWVVMDALDAASVRRAVGGADAVAYLVHALSSRDFVDLDRRAAAIMRDALDDEDVPRCVYLSGLVPDLPHDQLSAHLSSRLEVEEVLLGSRAAVASLRAGVVLGAGSTSFEIIRQLAAAMPVQPVPSWLQSSIQPIGVADAVRLLADALEGDDPLGAWDIGGTDIVPYPALLSTVSREARLLRVQLPVPLVPVSLVALAAPLFCAAPAHTVSALVESLRHDMVCRPDRTWRPGAGTSLRDAVRASLGAPDTPERLRPHLRQPGDPTWTSGRLLGERVTGVRLPLPAVARATAVTAETRALGLLSRLRP